MVKLVSPKYLGNQTSLNVKKRVMELLYTWTVDLEEEPKVLEAYNMLKKQGIIKVTRFIIIAKRMLIDFFLISLF